eukprot:gene5405-6025_t
MLGCVLDGQLRFDAQIDRVKSQMLKRNCLLKRLAGTKWGADRSLLRQLHQGCGQAVAGYASGIYLSFASATQRAKVESEQRRAACIISGCTSSTPAHAVLRESGLLPLHLRAQQQAAVLYERLRRFPAHMETDALTKVPHKTRIMLEGGRGVRPCWRSTAREVSERAGTAHVAAETLLFTSTRAPWEWSALPGFYDEMLHPVRRWESPAVRRQAALDSIAAVPGNQELFAYTDGSARGGTSCGGSGWYITTAGGAPLVEGFCAAGRICSSYRAEAVAMRNGLQTLQKAMRRVNAERPDLQMAIDVLGPYSCLGSMAGLKIMVLTDSQSLVRRLKRGPLAQRNRIESEIWDLIQMLWAMHAVQFNFVWIPSHTDDEGQHENLLSGNRVADVLASK